MASIEPNSGDSDKEILLITNVLGDFGDNKKGQNTECKSRGRDLRVDEWFS
jgi:hypothetical protein